MSIKWNAERVAALKNRVKQGLLAFFGALAIMGAAFSRASATSGKGIDVPAAAKFSAGVSAVAGVLWAAMPRASDPLLQTVDAIKAEVVTVTRMAASAAISLPLPTTPPQALPPRFAPTPNYLRTPPVGSNAGLGDDDIDVPRFGML